MTHLVLYSLLLLGHLTGRFTEIFPHKNLSKKFKITKYLTAYICDYFRSHNMKMLFLVSLGVVSLFLFHAKGRIQKGFVTCL